MPRFFCSTEAVTPGGFALFGAPLDITTCFRHGTNLGPASIRDISEGLEDYDPISRRSLEDRAFADLGDLDMSGALEDSHAAITEFVEGLLAKSARPFMLGGEHSVTPAAVRAMTRTYPDLVVIQFDAHADLRQSYEGNDWSHACAMRRSLDFIAQDALFQCGIRSGTREEFEEMERQNYARDLNSLPALAKTLKDRPVYITVDLDVLDPSILPGTGTPEPGGWTFQQLDSALRILDGVRLVGADVTELAPDLDPTGVSSVVAAKIVRTLLLHP